MALTYVQVAEGPSLYTIPVYNAASTDIPVYSPVMVDTNNNLTNTIGYLAVSVPGTTTSVNVIGFTQVTIPSLGTGRITPVGQVTNAVCYQTVNAGSVVDNCTVPTYTQRIQSHVATSPQCGIALADGADADVIPIVLCAARDA